MNGNSPGPGGMPWSPPQPQPIGLPEIISMRLALADTKNPSKEIKDSIQKLDTIIWININSFNTTPVKA